MWRKRFGLASLRRADARRTVPALVGDERVLPSEQRRRHSVPDIDEATRAWALLAELIIFASFEIHFEGGVVEWRRQGRRGVDRAERSFLTRHLVGYI